MAIGRKKKALVHIAKDDLRLDHITYHQILKGVAGVGSASELTREGFERVMGRFREMGFRGLRPYSPYPVKGRLIPLNSPQELETITVNQQDFVSYLLERLEWNEEHYHAFCRRIVKKPVPLTKRDGQKIIIGLMAVWRKQSRIHRFSESAQGEETRENR